jgi:nuclear pore complex protein Nup155
LFQKASSHLSSSKLSEVVQEYNSLRFQTGAIDLALTCADSWDSEERGLSWWRDGSPKNDSRAPSWEPRKFCYDRVLETLQSADDLLNSAIESNGREGGVSTGEADGIRSNAYSRALACNTDALHFALYDWHLERRLTDQLLEVRASTHSSGDDYLEQYLLREPVSLERYDLLWQYYARHYQHSKAASVLATLAESTEFPTGSISLNKRLEYLSLASSNAKSQFPNPGIRQDIIGFLTELDEKLEVGTVQVEIFRQIEELPSGAIEDRQRDALLKRLEERLFSISELYAEFAEPLHLHEVKLLIFHVSDHRDEEHIARTWEALIDHGACLPLVYRRYC